MVRAASGRAGTRAWMRATGRLPRFESEPQWRMSVSDGTITGTGGRTVRGNLKHSGAGGRGRIPCAGVFLLCLLFSGCFTMNVGRGLGPYEEHIVESAASSTSNKILLIDVEGFLSDERRSSSGLLSTGEESIVAQVKEKLRKASQDDDVKAVVFRIETPGGTATASDIVYREIMRFRERSNVKVIAAMMDIAASGGYYISAAADKIVAHPTTVTGSIGVVALFPNVKGLAEKLGLRFHVIKSGPMKDLGSVFRDMSEEERGILQGVIDSLHERFINVVERGRPGLSTDEVRRIADGRIYTAEQALRLKLIDGIGYLSDAVDLAKVEAGIRNAHVVVYHRPGAYVENVYSKTSVTASPLPMPSLYGDLWKILPVNAPRFLYLWEHAIQ